MRISDWSSDVCSSDLIVAPCARRSPAWANWATGTSTRRRSGAVRPHWNLRDRKRRIRGVLHPPAGVPSPCGGGSGIFLEVSIMSTIACDTPHSALDEPAWQAVRSEEHTSELQSLMRISYAAFCL